MNHPLKVCPALLGLPVGNVKSIPPHFVTAEGAPDPPFASKEYILEGLAGTVILPEADLVPEYTPVQVKLKAKDKLNDTV